MKLCEEPLFVEIFKMIRGFFLKWTGSCRNIWKKSSDYYLKQLLRKLFTLEIFDFLP